MTSALNVNVFTAPEKAIVGERPRPWGPPMAWDATTSTLIFGENDAVLVDTLTTADEAEALARWIELHHRHLAAIGSPTCTSTTTAASASCSGTSPTSRPSPPRSQSS